MSPLDVDHRRPFSRVLSNLTTDSPAVRTIRTSAVGGRGQSGPRRVQSRNRQPFCIGGFDETLSFLEARMSAQAGKMHISFAGKMH